MDGSLQNGNGLNKIVLVCVKTDESKVLSGNIRVFSGNLLNRKKNTIFLSYICHFPSFNPPCNVETVSILVGFSVMFFSGVL